MQYRCAVCRGALETTLNSRPFQDVAAATILAAQCHIAPFRLACMRFKENRANDVSPKNAGHCATHVRRQFQVHQDAAVAIPAVSAVSAKEALSDR